MIQAIERGALLARKLIANQHQIDLLLLEQARFCAEFAETEHWDDEGFTSPYDWIRISCHLTSNQVYDRVTVGERMQDLKASVEAVESGEIGFNHLATMAKT